MGVLWAFLFGFVFSSIIMGESALQTILLESGEISPDNFIEFKSAPDKVVDGAVVHVRYRCLRPCRLAVEVAVSTLRKTDLVLFRRRWMGGSLGAYRIHQVRPRLPPSILYRHDFFNQHVLEVDSVTVRAWLADLSNGTAPRTYHESALKIHKVLERTPLSERPLKAPTASLSWFARLTWQTTTGGGSRCPHEADVIEVLSFPLASTGENFGLVRRFQPFIDGALERGRLHAVTQPSVTLSAWIYLLEWCQEPVCGIIHHVDGRILYDSVLMQLTDTGAVIIQARVTRGEDEAFRISAALPLQKWIRLDCHIHNSKVVLDLSWDGETHRFRYNFQNSIYYDDTDGYFVIGGGRYLKGIHGYFGPIKYYRFGTEEIKNELRLEMLRELEKTHHECQEIKAFAKAFLKEVTESHVSSAGGKAVCVAHFIRLRGQYEKRSCTRTWTWGTPIKYSSLFHFLQTREERLQTGSLGVRDLGTALFKEAVDAMFTADRIQMTPGATSLLQTSSCFGNHEASLLLASVHLSGLARSVDRSQGHVYSLIGASADGRFALMHAGYKHAQGIDGFPKDLDMAYSYYSNAGAQCNRDLAFIHEDEQYVPQHVYLSKREDLDGLTDETSDAFQFLRFQAERGDKESQRRLGTMLYWGQNGVSKDIASAVKWLQRSSMQMKDPSAMYDYSVLLMKGTGVKRNYTRGLQLLRKAAAMGSVDALNGLGWYHGIVLKDHGRAVRYFEEAALNGSSDAMFNLGLYHRQGLVPPSPRSNETAAFLHFLNASRSGHAAASVEAAWYLSTGSLEGVSQDVESAVIMLKKVCERNGHLGFMIREALWAYLQGSRHEALVKYVLAAETGLGLAQSNAAHLCEELDLGPDCQWRYHNHSISHHDPHPSALLKMGDYYYYSSGAREDSLSLLGQAVSMYSRAALAGSPQGMYNLVVLAWQGHALPQSVRGLCNASRYDGEGAVVEKMLTRCVQSEHEEAVTPCSLALLGIQMGKVFSRMTQTSAQLLLAYASLLSVCILIVFMPFQSRPRQRVGCHRSVGARAPPLSRDGVESSGEQNGIMGGRGRAAGTLRRTALNAERWLRQTSDLAVTLSGVCLCVFWTTFLYQLL